MHTYICIYIYMKSMYGVLGESGAARSTSRYITCNDVLPIRVVYVCRNATCVCMCAHVHVSCMQKKETEHLRILYREKFIT